MKGLGFSVLFFIFSFALYAQQKNNDVAGPTSGTDIFHRAPPKPEKNKWGDKKLLKIIRKDTRGILYGNKCFEEFTYQLGFEYVVRSPDAGMAPSETGRFIHNFWVKTLLIFKAGPFWKSRVNKRIRECRQTMGDFAG